MPSSAPFRFVSFGGGVNSVAMLLRLVREGQAPDLVVFADTGHEHAYTYEYVRDYIEPFCRHAGIPFHRVQSKRGPMVAWMRKHRLIPSRMKRDCTFHWKVYPVRRLLRSMGAKKAVALLGIAWDESHREKPSDVKWITNRFPLIEWRMKRTDCLAEIAAAGWPSPGKSACVGCFNAGKKGLLRFAKRDPVEFAAWRDMEQNARRFPKLTLIEGERLDRIEKEARDQRTLDGFADDDLPEGECLGGVCGVA